MKQNNSKSYLHVGIILILSVIIFPVLSHASEGNDLVKAATAGKITKVQTLLKKGVDINHLKRDFTPLMGASYKGNVEIVQVLLENNAKVDFKNKSGDTALNIASMRGHTEIVRALLARGAKINNPGRGGYTPLIYASGGGHSEIVKTLLDKGAKVDYQTKQGITSLKAASDMKRDKVVQILLANGAKK